MVTRKTIVLLMVVTIIFSVALSACTVTSRTESSADKRIITEKPSETSEPSDTATPPLEVTVEPSPIVEEIATPIPDEEVLDYKTGNLAGNIYAYGVLAQQDEWVYYNSCGDDSSLYKMKVDGSEKQKLCDDDAGSINVVGQWVYYVDYYSELKRIGIDGANEQVFLEEDVSNLMVDTNAIYFISEDDRKIYRMKHDGSGSECITTYECWSFCLSEGALFIQTSIADLPQIKRLDPATLQSEIVITEDLGTSFLDGEWLYYSGIDGLGRVQISTGEKTELYDGNVLSAVLCGEWVYFHNGTHWLDSVGTSRLVGNLYRMRTDGTDKEVIDDGLCLSINATEDYIYFSRYDDAGKKLVWYRMRTDLTGKEKVE